MKKEDKLHSSGKEEIHSCLACPNRFQCDFYCEWLTERFYDPLFPPERPDCNYWNKAVYLY